MGAGDFALEDQAPAASLGVSVSLRPWILYALFNVKTTPPNKEGNGWKLAICPQWLQPAKKQQCESVQVGHKHQIPETQLQP